MLNNLNQSTTNISWLEDLPSLLARLEARPLEKPGNLYSNPRHFWRTDNRDMFADEYYVLHTEGYSYIGESGRASKHPVLTGFSLMERAEVLGSLCEGPLRSVVNQDVALKPDPFRFADDSRPLVMSNILELTPDIPLMPLDKAKKQGISDIQRYELKKDQEQKLRYEKQPHLAQALKRATDGKQLVVAVFYREADTLDLLMETFRSSFLLNENDPLPQHLIVLKSLIPEQKLVQPLENVDNKRITTAEVLAWRDSMVRHWQELLSKTFEDHLISTSSICAVIVELDKSTHSEGNILKITPDRRSIRGVIREACARLNILSQLVVTPARLTGIPKQDSASKGKALQTVQEIVTRQIGALHGIPEPLYRSVGLNSYGKDISNSLDIIALSFCSTKSGVNYCLATRLNKYGTLDVLLPEDGADWIPYAQAGPSLGRIFAAARKDVVKGKIGDAPKYQPEKQSRVRLKTLQINGFIEHLLTKKLERPTLIILEAEKWRSARDNGGGWWQLQNTLLADFHDCLIFGNRWKEEEWHCYERMDTSISHLLGIVRLRTAEMPQYITNRQDWQFEDVTLMRNYFEQTGFIDQTVTKIFHYYSIGRLPLSAAKSQKKKTLRDHYKIVSGKESGGGVAYRHPGLIEMVPFFVRPDIDNDEGLKVLCRIPHFLRSSPSWAVGNLDSPYPLHLGDVLIEDQLCILGLGDD